MKKEMKKLPTGALLALTGLVPKITINDLRKIGTQYNWDIAFIDYTVGEPNAYIRLQEANSAKDVSRFILCFISNVHSTLYFFTASGCFLH